MTEYEVASLFNELFTAMLTAVETFMAALFAMLATAYFVASKLTRIMSATIIGLFTLFSVEFIFFAFAASRRVAGFGSQLESLVSPSGSDLSWLYFVPAVAPIVPAVVAAILLAAYVAALIFFLQARRGSLVA